MFAIIMIGLHHKELTDRVVGLRAQLRRWDGVMLSSTAVRKSVWVGLILVKHEFKNLL